MHKLLLPALTTSALALALLAGPAQAQAPKPGHGAPAAHGGGSGAQGGGGGARFTCANTAATPATGTYKNVTVPEGATCYLVGATVTGNVMARNPTSVYVLDTEVAHNIMVSGATRDVAIGHRGCSFDPHAGNNIRVTDSHNVAICWMTVDNNVTVSGNDGRINVSNNTVRGSISVTRNLPYVALPGDGAHRAIDAIRIRKNKAGQHLRVSDNAGRPVIARHNTPAV